MGECTSNDYTKFYLIWLSLLCTMQAQLQLLSSPND